MTDLNIPKTGTSATESERVRDRERATRPGRSDALETAVLVVVSAVILVGGFAVLAYLWLEYWASTPAGPGR